MNTTLDYLRSNRKFLVTDFVVYGDYSDAEGGLLYTEQVSSERRMIFAHSFISDDEQEIYFGNLYDYKSNQLPGKINNPKIIILPKNDVYCFLVGSETETGFKIAKDNPAKTGLVDLLIIEME